MTIPGTDESLALDFERMLEAAAGEILNHPDPARFAVWFRDNVVGFMPAQARAQADPEIVRAFATVMGRSIWNATPLPDNGFRPRSLGPIKRNDVCPCGSGDKFKRCCGRGQDAIPLATAAMWPRVLAHLSDAAVAEAAVKGRLPGELLANRAYLHGVGGDPAKVVALLEPVFLSGIRDSSAGFDAAFHILLVAYDELEYTERMGAVLERIVAQPEASPLRGGAWQRIAMIRMNGGDSDGAWEAYRNAGQDNPEAADLGGLEVALLMAQGRAEEARASADTWIERLKAQGFEDGDPPLRLLEAIVREPALEKGLESSGGDSATGQGT
jgi:hypothetical protein